MQSEQDLRIGYIPYLNCAPFFYYLKDCGFEGAIVPGVPSALNAMLQRSEIDVSPSSSFEYALNSHDYLLLPEYSISSRGPVKSVLLFSPYAALNDLQGEQIAITGESATSINLLRVLLLEFVGLTRVDDYVPDQDVETLIKNKQPALLIGNRAMQQADDLPDGMHCHDLGAIWYELTGLPFVFALWIVRRDSAETMADKISALHTALGISLRRAFSNLEELAEQTGAAKHEVSGLVNYWQTIDYSLTDQHIAGFELFAELCVKHNLLKKSPDIEFFQPLLG